MCVENAVLISIVSKNQLPESSSHKICVAEWAFSATPIPRLKPDGKKGEARKKELDHHIVVIEQ